MQGVQAFDARLTLFFCNLHTPHSKALAQKKEKKKNRKLVNYLS